VACLFPVVMNQHGHRVLSRTQKRSNVVFVVVRPSGIKPRRTSTHELPVYIQFVATVSANLRQSLPTSRLVVKSLPEERVEVLKWLRLEKGDPWIVAARRDVNR